MRKKIDPAARFQYPSGASAITGFSRDYIYMGCKSGEIPHIRCGRDYRVDMTAWLAILTEKSAEVVCSGS